MTDPTPIAPTPAAAPATPSPNVSLEAQLREANAESYKRNIEIAQKNKALAVLSDELKSAVDKLGELDKLKSQLISLASDRLLFPVGGIRGYSQMLNEGDYGEVPEKMKQPIAAIVESTAAMDVMISHFLKASEIASGLMTYRAIEFNLADSAREVFAHQSTLASTKHVTLNNEITSDALNVSADPDNTRMIFTIIIENAIHYTRENGAITVKLSKSEDGKNARFEVSDNGIGMTEDTVSKLFHQFVRGENGRELWIGGLGLGLYIAKNLVDGHKGIISAHSDGVGKGSVFVVELPLLT